MRGERLSLSGCLGLAVCGLVMLGGPGRGADYSFTNSLALAALAEQQGDISNAARIFDQAGLEEPNHAVHLCVLARRYCDLTCLTNSAAAQKELTDRALACSLRAETLAPNSATAHACVAVCYAKECAFADTRSKVNDSRSFKLEAEKTIALNPREDIAYYLLGRWNFEVANLGLLSRALVKVVYGGLPKASNEAAIANFKKAAELAPERIIHHAGLAMAYEAVGNKELELAELKKCRSLKPAGLEDRNAQQEAIKKLAALGPSP